MINNDISTWLYTQSWIQFGQLKNQKQILEKAMGRSINDIEHKVACCIACSPTTVTDLMSEKYFDDVSLSTMKRAVSTLLECGVIETKTDKKDRRKKILKFKG